MPMRRGKCINFGLCNRADSREVIQVPEGADLVCPECEKPLQMAGTGQVTGGLVNPHMRSLLIVGLAAVVVTVLFVVRGNLLLKPSINTPAVGEIVLRLCGSNTIGSSLGPALAEAFFKMQGAEKTARVPGSTPDELRVTSVLPGERNSETITIEAHGSATAFERLAAGTCDIGMSSRRVSPDEAARLQGLGDMTSSASEHVLGLDGVAVIVNRANPVDSLSIDQVRGIFGCKIRDWAEVGGSRGAVQVYARDDKSGTYDTFKTLVLGNQPLCSVRRFEDSRALADQVTTEAAAIGFVMPAYVGTAKALAISEAGTAPVLPSQLSIGTEDYPLSRRLYLYTPSNSQSSWTQRFVQFALSKPGQDLVSSGGFVGQNVLDFSAAPVGTSREYRNLTAGAQRLSLDFHFGVGTSELDNKGIADLQRVASFLSDPQNANRHVLLIGFADNTGSKNMNCALAAKRAETVAAHLASLKVRADTVSLCSGNSGSSGDTKGEGENNRRVEIWIKR